MEFNPSNKQKVFMLVVALAAYAFYSVVTHKHYVEKLQAGDITLECTTKENGTFIVDPARITDFDMDTQTVYFDNGYATTCKTVKE